MADIKITQIRSKIGGTKVQRDTLRSLGLKRIGHSVVKEDGPTIRGYIKAIPHLVTFEELS